MHPAKHTNTRAKLFHNVQILAEGTFKTEFFTYGHTHINDIISLIFKCLFLGQTQKDKNEIYDKDREKEVEIKGMARGKVSTCQ